MEVADRAGELRGSRQELAEQARARATPPCTLRTLCLSEPRAGTGVCSRNESLLLSDVTCPNRSHCAQLSELKEQHGQFRQEVVSRIEEKNAQIRRAEEENRQLRAQLAARAPAGEAAALREQCDNHQKERAALKTILENKARVAHEFQSPPALPARRTPGLCVPSVSRGLCIGAGE